MEAPALPIAELRRAFPHGFLLVGIRADGLSDIHSPADLPTTAALLFLAWSVTAEMGRTSRVPLAELPDAGSPAAS